MPANLQCYGDPAIIEEGRKSFPSGHTGCKSNYFVVLYTPTQEISDPL